MKTKSYFLVSLGCAKNSVDSQSMATLLEEDGFSMMERPSQARFLIVNTCGFIASAREESIQTLQELAASKKPGQLLIATGCLPDRIGHQIATMVPGIDGVLSTRRWMDILDLVQRLRPNAPSPIYHIPEGATVGTDEQDVLRAAIQGTSAYLKIADGCRRPCAFCSIPLIKGTAVSRPMEVILEEARILTDMGMQELILIAQDTTDYGSDLGMKDGLAQLLEQLSLQVPDLPWIRVMYAYPGSVSERLIDVMATQPNILHYLDIPLQHAHPDTLRRMRRPANMDWVRETIRKMRTSMPDLAVRTTFIVGYPGETDAEFDTLLEFITEMQFDKVGTFTFSFEPGTTSEPLGDPVPQEEKEQRREQLMLKQEAISLHRNQSLVGSVLPVLIEGQSDGLSIGRSYRDAPEIDGLVLVEGDLPEGELVPVQITGALVHDLTGIPARVP
jgi:ribosomal protein S12 methylthiotransferase